MSTKISHPGSKFNADNIRFWIVLDQGKLSEYVNWKDRLDLHMDPIDLRVASVREARNSERRFCFEIITPHYTRVYQAPSEEEMRVWISSINNALQSAFESKTAGSISPVPTQQPHSTRKDIAAVLTGKSSSFSGHRSTTTTASAYSKSPNRHATTGDKPNYLRAETTDAHPSELLMRIREADEGNKYCADCNSETKVDWVSINLGIVLCIECSGIHRSLGTHISKIRSLTLDTAAFTPDIVELLLLVGNRVSNMIWEAKLDRFLKPAPHSTREQRLHFITSKYSDRAYVERLALQPDEYLLTSIKRNEMQNVLHALANRANPNAQDRSRSTPAVYLALAATDPAMPGSSAPSFSHSRGTSTSTITAASLAPPPYISSPNPDHPPRPQTPTRKPFPAAELLFQNGADIPSQPAPIILSPAARQYLEFKTEQRTGRLAGPGSVGPDKPGGDALGALPSFSGGAGGTSPSQRDLGKRQGWMTGASSGFVGGVKALGEATGRRS